MSAWRTCNMLIGAVERCRTTPEWHELIYSPAPERSQELFSGRAPEGIEKDDAERVWKFPNGSTLIFGHVRHDDRELLGVSFDDW